MSQANVEIVRGIYDAWQRGDLDGGIERFDEEIEWIGPPDVSRRRDVERGREEARRSLISWVAPWDDYRFELRQLIDCGDQVLAEGWQQGRGKESGVEISEEIFSAWTLQAGKVIRQRMFRDRAQALEAVGLEE